MKIAVLIGQRKESYEGQFAPEVLGSQNLIHYDEDHTFLDNMAMENEEAFSAIEIIAVEVDDKEIDKILNKNMKILTGKIIKEG